MNKMTVQYAIKYWRLVIHLVFKTKHFGVNNLWWSKQPSSIGWHWYQQLWGLLTVMPIVRNIQSLKVRSRLGWIPKAESDALGFK